MTKEEREYLILKSISDGQETIRQRDIAKIAGVSLGMTNTIIKRLIGKGLLKSKYITSKKIKYFLTPEGLSLVTNRGGDFLKRTIKNVVVFNKSIDIIVKEVKNNGFNTINLVGKSDLVFLLKHSCEVNCMKLKITQELKDKHIKNIYADELGREVLDSYLVEAVL